MECMFENVPRKSLLPGQAGAVIAVSWRALWTSHRPQDLSPHCCLWPPLDIGRIPEQNPVGACAFECW